MPNGDDPSTPKASGLVQLPVHVRWSGAPKTYDLGLRKDRARVYEQVLREGTTDDVHLYVDVDQLIDLWDELVLPRPVRQAWAEWILQHRNVEVAC
ncbi:MAG TPA: hypothetical protein VNC61_08405 [Acidimicrobiales bacterium]|nr:hypothetical protein [Acidimicrobiales bacterium]